MNRLENDVHHTHGIADGDVVTLVDVGSVEVEVLRAVAIILRPTLLSRSENVVHHADSIGDGHLAVAVRVALLGHLDVHRTHVVRLRLRVAVERRLHLVAAERDARQLIAPDAGLLLFALLRCSLCIPRQCQHRACEGQNKSSRHRFKYRH